MSRVGAACLVALAGVLIGGCDEHLPPANDPNKLLAGQLSAAYVLTSTQNVIALRLTIYNIYEEVVEGSTAFDGNLTLSLLSDPAVTRTYDLGSLGVQFARDYNPSTRFLRLMPGDSIAFLVNFNFVDDRGLHFTDILNYYPDPLCPDREATPPQTYIVRAEVSVFPRISKVVPSPVLYNLCHVTQWIHPNNCPTVNGPLDVCARPR